MLNALVISYLFLGGMGAGSFVVLSCAWALSSRKALAGRATDPLLRPGYRGFLGVGYGVSLAIQIVGVLCLLIDLERPEALPYLLISPQPSAVAVGAYSLAVLTLCTLVLAATRLGIVRIPRVAEGVLAVAGSLDACAVMAYTAILLKSCVGNPFWSSPLIVVLFVLSSLSTGIACVVVVSVFFRGHGSSKGLVRRLLSVDLALVAAELTVTGFFMVWGVLATPQRAAYASLLWGSLAEAFWIGLVGFGLVAPALLNLFGRRMSAAQVSPLAVSLLVLVGGVCLRYCIVAAGVL